MQRPTVWGKKIGFDNHHSNLRWWVYILDLSVMPFNCGVHVSPPVSDSGTAASNSSQRLFGFSYVE